MVIITCSNTIGIESDVNQLVNDSGFLKQGYYNDHENMNFGTFDKEGLIMMKPGSLMKHKIKQNVDISSGVLVIRKNVGYNNPNVDKTIGYCTCKKWTNRFDFHVTQKVYKPCLVIMNSFSDDKKIKFDVENNVKQIIEFIKSKKLRSLYITGHSNTRQTPFEMLWCKETKEFLKKLFIALKDLCSKQILDKKVEDSVTSKVEDESISLNNSSQLSFLSSSPTIDESPKTPSSARRLMLNPELNKQVEDSDAEIMKRYILQQRSQPLFPDLFLKEKMVPGLYQIETIGSPKRQRID